MQAVSVYEAGLTADPFNSALKAGLQRVQQRLIQDMLHGKALNHKALPAPPIPERITLAPHNVTRAALCKGLATKPSQRLGLSPGQQYSVGWREAAVQVIQAAESGELGGEGVHWQGDCATDTWQQLPRLLLTPAAAVADPALRDVYEYVSTQVSRLHCLPGPPLCQWQGLKVLHCMLQLVAPLDLDPAVCKQPRAVYATALPVARLACSAGTTCISERHTNNIMLLCAPASPACL